MISHLPPARKIPWLALPAPSPLDLFCTGSVGLDDALASRPGRHRLEAGGSRVFATTRLG